MLSPGRPRCHDPVYPIPRHNDPSARILAVDYRVLVLFSRACRAVRRDPGYPAIIDYFSHDSENRIAGPGHVGFAGRLDP